MGTDCPSSPGYGGGGVIFADMRCADLRRAVNQNCECGGEGPGWCCAACRVWHTLAEDFELDAATPNTETEKTDA